MTTDREDKIKTLRRQIVLKLEGGEDVSELSRQLARVRAEIAAAAEVEELQKVAEQRLEYQKIAGDIQARVKRQSEAIDRLFVLLNSIVVPLKEVSEKAVLLQVAENECREGFPNGSQFNSFVASVPAGYLTKDMTCPMLVMGNPARSSYQVSYAAMSYIKAGLDLLSDIKREEHKIVEHKIVDEELGDISTSEVEPICRVCNHERAAEINEALKAGRSLRELETGFNVSRSTLSRHKNRCLNLGATKSTEAE